MVLIALGSGFSEVQRDVGKFPFADLLYSQKGLNPTHLQDPCSICTYSIYVYWGFELMFLKWQPSTKLKRQTDLQLFLDMIWRSGHVLFKNKN